MRIHINLKQLKLLTDRFTITENGLMPLSENLITESMPQYIVSMWISAYPVEVRIGTTTGSGGAMAVARKLFKNARVYSARSA